ncbi:FtsX-like permease family protein [Paenibacillus sp. GbtcB18]|uniref:FtsX-like permease family protein n=1 Tax=Paenibacillus sp. GbtcB18 TaxID=2824763 RepID=UPI001C2FA76B|nr:FtsX-like permease family protein [Paenibacillus sp. GbtcB18]
MPRTNSSSVLLFLVFVCIGFFTSMAVSYLNKYKLVEKISQNYVGDEAIFFRFERLSSVDKTSLQNTLKRGDILYKKIDPAIKEILFKDRISPFPMIEGHSFDGENKPGKNIAVVGRDIHKTMGEKEAYMYHGISYEIIGVTGIDKPSKLDRMVFLQTDNAQADTKGIWILDGNNNLEDTFQNIQRFSEQSGGSVKKVDVPGEGLGRFFQNEPIFKMIDSLVVLSFITCASALTVYWVEQRKQMIAIQKLCGFSTRFIFWDSFKRYLAISVLSYAAGSIMGLFVLPQSSYSPTDLLAQYGSTILIGIAVCLIPLTFMMKRSTDRAVRRVQ